MAIAHGLTMAIANPSQDLLMNAAAATDLLMHKPGSDLKYINRMLSYKQNIEKQEQEKRRKILQAGGAEAPSVSRSAAGQDDQIISPDSGQAAVKNSDLYQAVLHGEKNSIVKYAEERMEAGRKPEEVINEYLIPAINEVGELFNQQKYFLPQLIASANAMKAAIEYLEPKIERSADSRQETTLVIATVEGDIHDIGKNLVVLMLRNYGYHVTWEKMFRLKR